MTNHNLLTNPQLRFLGGRFKNFRLPNTVITLTHTYPFHYFSQFRWNQQRLWFRNNAELVFVVLCIVHTIVLHHLALLVIGPLSDCLHIMTSFRLLTAVSKSSHSSTFFKLSGHLFPLDVTILTPYILRGSFSSNELHRRSFTVVFQLILKGFCLYRIQNDGFLSLVRNPIHTAD